MCTIIVENTTAFPIQEHGSKMVLSVLMFLLSMSRTSEILTHFSEASVEADDLWITGSIKCTLVLNWCCVTTLFHLVYRGDPWRSLPCRFNPVALQQIFILAPICIPQSNPEYCLTISDSTCLKLHVELDSWNIFTKKSKRLQSIFCHKTSGQKLPLGQQRN